MISVSDPAAATGEQAHINISLRALRPCLPRLMPVAWQAGLREAYFFLQLPSINPETVSHAKLYPPVIHASP